MKLETVVGAVFVLLVAVCAAVYGCMPHIKKELRVEAGSTPPAAVDFISKDAPAEAVDGLDAVAMDRVGEYPVTIHALGKDHRCTVYVEDTTAPLVKTKAVTAWNHALPAPEDFIESVEDATQTKVTYIKTPRRMAEGVQIVALCVTDEGGNVCEVSAVLRHVIDGTAPVLDGVAELTVEQGGSVAYWKNVRVTDDWDTEPSRSVENAGVNLDVIGDYPVVYIVRDAAGNETRAATVVHVVTPFEEGVSEERVNEVADALLKKILPADATMKEKAYRIYRWVRGNIAYVDTSRKSNYLQSAYDGMVKHRGDCYTYAMTSKVLLTRAGIPNRDICKIPTRSLHYWNLIDIGEGWYHFDATPRAGGPEFFYKTDAALMAYSNAHRGTHRYDREIYTNIQ